MHSSTPMLRRRGPKAIARSREAKHPWQRACWRWPRCCRPYGHGGDRDAVERTVLDKRWQMVLDGLGAQQPPLSPGTLCNCRMRLMAHDWEKVLLARTVAWAEPTGGRAWGGCARPWTPSRSSALTRSRKRRNGLAVQSPRPSGMAATGPWGSLRRLSRKRTWPWEDTAVSQPPWTWIGAHPLHEHARGAACWRRWSVGSDGSSSHRASRSTSLRCRRSWRRVIRWSRRTRSQTPTGAQGGGVSRRAWRPTAASLLKTKTCGMAARAAPKLSTAFRSTGSSIWTAPSPGGRGASGPRARA